MADIISLKGCGDGVVLKISSSAIFSDVAEAIAEKIKANRSFFRGNYKVYIESISPLSKSDIIRLKSVIDTYLPDCEVIYKEPGVVENYTSSERKSPKRGNVNKTQSATVYERDIEAGEHLRVVGNAVILGSVSANGAVTAGGSVVVLGDISGCVRAGYRVNEDAYVIFRTLSGGEIYIANSTLSEERYKLKSLDLVPEDALKKAHLIKNSIEVGIFL